MATKIKRILSSVPQDSLFFSSWLAEQGIDRKEQTLYVRSGWLERIANGVYKLERAVHRFLEYGKRSISPDRITIQRMPTNYQ